MQEKETYEDKLNTYKGICRQSYPTSKSSKIYFTCITYQQERKARTKIE